MAVLHYSPSDVIVTIAGLYQVEGYVDGTFINLTKNVKPYDTKKAMDGEIGRIFRKDTTFTLELTVAQTSAANNILSAIYNIDIATQIGKFPLFIKDGMGSTTFMSLSTWVQDVPAVTFSNEIESRTWILGCSQATLNVGGNDEQNLLESIGFFGTSLLPLLKDFGVF